MAVYHINEWFVEGNVGADATTGTTKGGDMYTRFSIANTQGDRTNWVSCVMWGEGRASLAPRIRKGMKVVVVGNASIDSWTPTEGENAGREVSKLACNVRTISLPREASGGSAEPQMETFSATDDDEDDLDL